MTRDQGNDTIVDPAATRWHFDRRIPLALIVVLVLQTTGGIWYVSRVTSQVEANKAAIERIDLLVADIPSRLASMETSLEFMVHDLRTISNKLDASSSKIRED